MITKYIEINTNSEIDFVIDYLIENGYKDFGPYKLNETNTKLIKEFFYNCDDLKYIIYDDPNEDFVTWDTDIFYENYKVYKINYILREKKLERILK